MALLGQEYSGSHVRSPSWWISLNAVLAISYRRRAETAQTPGAEERSWACAATALSATLDVLMRDTQLASVQALVSLAWFFVGTPNPQPAFMLVGCALRLAHAIGLHVDCNEGSWSTIERCMRKKVFWIAASLDQELCLRTGRPTCHDLRDSQLSLPTHAPDALEIVTTTDGTKVDLCQAQAQFALIQAHIRHALPSGKLTSHDIPDGVHCLSEKLEKWSAEFAPAVAQTHAPRTCEHRGLMRLYISFCNAVIIVNRSCSTSYWASLDPTPGRHFPARTKNSTISCLNAARSIAGLSRVVPCTWESFFWDNVSSLANAAAILSIHVLRDPSALSVESDLDSVQGILEVFGRLDELRKRTHLGYVRSACQELYSKANLRVESSKQNSSAEGHHTENNTLDGGMQPSRPMAFDEMITGDLFQVNWDDWGSSGQYGFLPASISWNMDLASGLPLG